MKRLLALVLVLSPTGLVGADDKPKDAPKPNALTPREVADGWLLLFDGRTTFGWRSPNESKWTVLDGLLAPQAGKPRLLVTATAFKDYEVRLDYQVRRDSRAQLVVGCDREGRAGSAQTVTLQYLGGGWVQARAQIQDGVVRDTLFQQSGILGVTASSTAFAAKEKNGKVEPPRPVGHLALSGNGVVFRNVKLRPTNLKPIFNGKDLTGWKVFKGKGTRSKFGVTPEGWLNVKDGRGDLQTEALYDDFVLQLECVSNGKHLNSGIFFRCQPGEYQKGYEAQIYNRSSEKPRAYVVEDYDPKTHKRLGTHKVPSTAVDYGTGAIYNRVPARFVAANDKEWFTLTVVARGRHFATWVNGVQVVDWTDNRPASDNGRNGYRAEKGAISIQGHDPTTDLSFRNFRLAELPRAKEK